MAPGPWRRRQLRIGQRNVPHQVWCCELEIAADFGELSGGESWDFGMKTIDCPNCGAPVSLLARSCSYCGAPNRRRLAVIIAGAVGAAVVAAVVAAAVIVVLGRSPQSEATSAAGRSITGTGDDFAWVSKAMEDCDRQAQKETGTLQFLVIPLVDEPRDDRGWRRISLNDIGNAILINGEDAIAGLKRRALRLATTQYVFSARDEATKVVYRWNPSTGVKHFVIAEAKPIESFKVQFESRDAGRAANWGATFVRTPGNCYWVNAILRD
jgi:hypothetical protein